MAMAMAVSTCVGAAFPSLHHPSSQKTAIPGTPTLALRYQTPAARAFSSPSSSFFSGCALAARLNVTWLVTKRPNVVKVRAKVALGCTKRSKSRKSRARTSGFRVRLQTPSGRNILKRRRAKGRKVLCPASNPNSGKLA